MAEGFTRALKGDTIEPYSAGVAPYKLSQRAAVVMSEAGVDISKQYSKDVYELFEIPFDYVITVCDNARESCPLFPGQATKIVHYGFEDPPFLAKDANTEEEALVHFRRVRDEIKSFVEKLPDILEELSE